MDNKKFALFIVAIVVILYLLYKYNSSYDLDVEKFDNSVNVQTQQTQIQTKPVFGVYYTEWCGYSQQFLSQLNNGVGQAIQNAGAELKLVDCDKDKQTCSKYNVEGFPTLILHSSKGDVHYSGQRTAEEIANFIKNNK